MIQDKIHILGGGLAGSEAAWQAARSGLDVFLYEMRPYASTGAHRTSNLAELVCSNSLGSNLPDRASGLLKSELRALDSLLMECADATALPAGGALAVDREAFSKLVTDRISAIPNIHILREEAIRIPHEPTIIATGPLTSAKFSKALGSLTGANHLYFFDAISPIVLADSIDMHIAFRASRYSMGTQDEGDYINCPLTDDEYLAFVNELVSASLIPLRDFEVEITRSGLKKEHQYFEGCLPAEIIARRGVNSLAFGPMRPTGLRDPRTQKRPRAVVQLRQDNLAGSLYNMVGFQTNLTYPEQKRVFQMIPGLGSAEFMRFGQMHRNTFIASPQLLLPTMQYRHRQDLFFAGQITGVEGYVGNIATGLLAGINASRLLLDQPLQVFPATTMIGALTNYITHANLHEFQPMKANLGILDPLIPDLSIDKRDRAINLSHRSMAEIDRFLQRDPFIPYEKK